MEKKKIGFIGLGAMGAKIAGRLLSEGYTLGVYNRTSDKAKDLVTKGAWQAKTPKELAEKSDVLILCVTDDTAIRTVMDGKNGALTGLKKGQVCIDCSTVSVQVTREMDKKTRSKGAHWLDAPVLGNPTMSEKGEQSFVIGGDEKVLKEVREVIESIGKKIVYMGASGLGQTAKLVHNLTCGISLVAYSEALVLGEKLGLSRKQTLEVLANGAVASTLLTIKTPKFEQNVFEPTMAPLINMHKDLSLATAAAKFTRLSLPALAATKKLYDKAKKLGLSRQDTSSVIKTLAPKRKN